MKEEQSHGMLSVGKNLDIIISATTKDETVETNTSINEAVDEAVSELFNSDMFHKELECSRNAFAAMTKKIDEALTKYNAIASLSTTLECIDMIIDDFWPTLNELEEIPAYAGRFGYHTGVFAELDDVVVWRVDNGLVKIDITEGEFNMLKWY